MPVYTYTTIDDPLATQGPNQGTAAQDIDSTGQIIGWYRDASGYHGFRLSGGKYTMTGGRRKRAQNNCRPLKPKSARAVN
jgi:hypothetical protein